MLEWADDLIVSGTELYLDSRRPRPLCFVSHAHTDHLGLHDRSIATAATAALAEHRIGLTGVTCLEYDIEHVLDDHTTVRLFPAGHVLGSAMIQVQSTKGTLLYTGDFKLRESLTAGRAAPPRADVLVMESTYGLPFFRFPPWRDVAAQLAELVEGAFHAGRQPIVLGYSLGKAQEATRLLTDAGFAVTAHGAPASLSRIYEAMGVKLGAFRRYTAEDFHGPRALDLRERGVLVAPPHVARSAFVGRFKNPLQIVLTGWALQKNAVYRYGVDHALPLSDHADFDELLQLVDLVRPERVFTHHGFPEFAETLRARGIRAELARPPEQLELFGEM